MRKPYFQTDPCAPPQLQNTIQRQVQFEEVDSMGIVWHGRYVRYFEEARVALGRRYGVSYSDFIRRRVPVPVRQLSIDYFEPLFFEDLIEVDAILHWTEAARINFEYVIRKKSKVVCSGHTIQLMLNEDFDLLLSPPPFYMEFMDKWKNGLLK